MLDCLLKSGGCLLTSLILVAKHIASYGQTAPRLMSAVHIRHPLSITLHSIQQLAAEPHVSNHQGA